MSDSLVDGNVDSGSQQQWISRNCDWKSWTGSNWNMVFVGVAHPPEGAWPSPSYTRKISLNGAVSVEGKEKLWYITRCHVLGAPKENAGFAKTQCSSIF